MGFCLNGGLGYLGSSVNFYFFLNLGPVGQWLLFEVELGFPFLGFGITSDWTLVLTLVTLSLAC